jgi:putative SOS response-associated peptidase YedK
MCGRFAVDKEVNELIEEFVAAGGDVQDWRPNWNIRPTDRIPVVFESVKEGELTRRLELARWSLVPSWSKELKQKFPTFNARSETAAEKVSFKGAVKSKRALIPAAGYYEWKTEGKVKTPFFIGSTETTLAFAGLYSWWKNPAVAEDDDAKWVLSTTIMTMPTVESLAPIHDRNPMPLPRYFWDDWLSPELDGDQGLVDAAVAASVPVAEAMTFHQVAPVVGDGPELIAPIS